METTSIYTELGSAGTETTSKPRGFAGVGTTSKIPRFAGAETTSICFICYNHQAYNLNIRSQTINI